MSVDIVEVLPRDGLQTMLSRPQEAPSTEQKLLMIRRLVWAGLRHIEVTSFAHPRWIPQFADAESVVQGLDNVPGVHYRALVPNVRGAERALAVGVPHLACLIVASESYQRKNSDMTIDQGLREIERIKRLADSAQALTSVSIGICFWCPYEGRIPESRVMGMVDRFVSWGITQVSVSDSIGCADPDHVGVVVKALKERYPVLKVGVHLHDFTGMGLTNAYAAWKAGADLFDCSLGGVGGGIRMPVNVRRMGNIATEDVVHLLLRCGVDTGVDLQRLREVSEWAVGLLGQVPNSGLARGGTVEEFLALGRADREGENRA